MTTSRSREIINEIQAEELATLRAERDQALADLRASRRECEILRGTKLGVGASVGYELCRPARRDLTREDQEDKDERMAMLEHVVRTLDAAMFDISVRYDCDGRDGEPEPNDDEECRCSVCMAKRALKLVEAWRFGGSKERPANRYESSYPERLTNGHYPREAKIHAAWAKAVDDFKLAQILKDRRPAPSARDWYVATSVVQWLATNVGMGVLEAAGYKYTQYDEDFASYEPTKQRRIAAANAALASAEREA